jgi:hypothetical protein
MWTGKMSSKQQAASNKAKKFNDLLAAYLAA